MYPLCSLAPALLLLLLLHLAKGHVLEGSERQRVDAGDPDIGGPPGLGAGEEPEGGAVVLESARRGGALAPGFGNPLDRIAAEWRHRPRPRQGPRRRISVPVDRIGRSYLPRRRDWSDYSEMDWYFYEDGLTDSVVDSALQLMEDE
ncbi:uncharacterized protein LOC144609660 [Rhinoraja longicauda]